VVPRFDIEEIKRRNPLEDVATQLGWKIDRHHMARCPFPGHEDTNPSCQVYPDEGRFWCHGPCQRGGDVIDLVALTQGMAKGDAITWLAQRAGMQPGQPAPPRPQPKLTSPPKSVATNPPPELQEFLSRTHDLEGEGLAYLEGRGISKEVAERLGVRFVPRDGQVVTAMFRRQKQAEVAGVSAFYVYEKLGIPYLVFPYYQGDHVTYIKTRCLPTEDAAQQEGLTGDRYRNTRGRIPCPYNVNRLRDPTIGRIFVAEGEMDTLTLETAGFPAVGVPGAGNFRKEWADLFGEVDVYLAMDPDKAGEAGMTNIAAAFGDRGRQVYRVPLPAGQDVNEFFGRRKHDEE